MIQKSKSLEYETTSDVVVHRFIRVYKLYVYVTIVQMYAGCILMVTVVAVVTLREIESLEVIGKTARA